MNRKEVEFVNISKEQLKKEALEFGEIIEEKLKPNENHVIHLPNYFGKKIEVRIEIEYGEPVLNLYLDGEKHRNILVVREDDGNLSFGVDIYFHTVFCNNVQKSVKKYMNTVYRLQEDEHLYNETYCKRCGDGGCINCEPHKFL